MSPVAGGKDERRLLLVCNLLYPVGFKGLSGCRGLPGNGIRIEPAGLSEPAVAIRIRRRHHYGCGLSYAYRVGRVPWGRRLGLEEALRRRRLERLSRIFNGQPCASIHWQGVLLCRSRVLCIVVANGKHVVCP